MSEKYFSGSLPFFSYILVMFIEQPPFFYRMLFPETIWRIPGDKKTVYLTFDDGPIPHLMPSVPDHLKQIGITRDIVTDTKKRSFHLVVIEYIL